MSNALTIIKYGSLAAPRRHRAVGRFAYHSVRMLAVMWLSLAALSGCTSTELASSLYKQGARPHYKVGNPYTIDGRTYFPAEVANYSEEGEASWYGPGFHGRQTANGEEFNTNDMTAAHRTLPMPSVVRVTNLENGRQVVVRVNDRGPFKRDRVLDVSQTAAKTLGFHGNGTTRVRVEFMPVESQMVAQAARQGGYLSLADALAFTGGNGAFNQTAAAAPSGKVEVANLDGTALPPTAAYQPVAYQSPVAAPNASQNTAAAKIVTRTTTVIKNPLYIQAGAYASRQKAEQVKSKLSGLGLTTITETTRGGMKLYRVRVMADSKGGAEKIQSSMGKMGFTGAKVLKD